MQSPQPEVLTLLDLGVFRRQWRWIVGCLLGVLLATSVSLELRRPLYEATADVALRTASAGDPNAETERIIFGVTSAETQRVTITSVPFLSRALRLAGLPSDPADARTLRDNHLVVEKVPDTALLRLRVTDTSRVQAAKLTSAVVDALLARLRDSAAERLRDALTALEDASAIAREQLAAVNRQLEGDPGEGRKSLEDERDELYARLRFLAAREAELETTYKVARPAHVVSPVTVTEQPISPRPLRSVAVALVLGILLGLAVAFVRDWTDGRVRGSTGVEAAGAAPLLVEISGSRTSRSPVVMTDPTGPSATQYSLLAAKLVARRRDKPCRIALIPADSASEACVVAVNLALALAAGGRRVGIVDAHLERPCASAQLGVEGPGVMDLLTAADRDPADVVVEHASGIRVIPSGNNASPPAQALWRLVNDHLTAAFDRLGGDWLVVLPAIAHAPGVLHVARDVAAAVVVARRGRTPISSLTSSAAHLRAADVEVLGTVLTGDH